MIGQAALHEHEALVPSSYVVDKPEERRLILTRLAKQYGSPRPCRSFPGGHPTSLTRADIARVHTEKCFFSLKTDGVRYLLLLCDIGGEYKAFCIDRCLRAFEIVVWCNEAYFTKTTLLDGELVFDHAQNRLCFQIFDVVTMLGRSCRSMLYSDRLQVLHNHILSEIPEGMDESSEIFEQYITDEDKIYCAHRTDRVCMHMAPKRFVTLEHAQELWNERHQSPFPNDGLIIHFDQCAIQSGTCRNMLKWKPNNAIDILLGVSGSSLHNVRCRKDGKEVDMHTLDMDGESYAVRVEDNHLLRCIVHRRQHGTYALVECLVSFSGDAAKLWPMRERTDKVEANDMRVIQSTLRVIRDNVTLCDLLSVSSNCAESSSHLLDNVDRRDQSLPATDSPVPEKTPALRRSKRGRGDRK